jgi:hypothetical protein
MLNKKQTDILENFDELEYKHMGDIVQYNPITCAHYYNQWEPYLIKRSHYLGAFQVIVTNLTCRSFCSSSNTNIFK